MRKIYLFTVGIMMMILASSGVSAQESISLTETEQPGSFPIVTDNSTAVIVFDTRSFSGSGAQKSVS